MKTLQERLKYARKQRGLSQAALGAAIGKSQSAIAAIESGRNKEATSIASLAQVLNVSALWLETGKGSPDGGANAHPCPDVYNEVPLISWVQAGHWSEAINLLQPGEGERIPTTYRPRRHTYALRVSGDSMEPEFTEGDIIIVEPDETPRHGSYVVVRQNGGEATFKKLVIDGSKTYLAPLNNRYPVLELNEDAAFCGVIKEKIKRY